MNAYDDCELTVMDCCVPQKVSWEPQFCNDTILYAVGICAAYLVVCFGGKWIMSNLKPFDLRV